MSSKRYLEEFKIEALKRVVGRGYSVVDVAQRLDITTHSLYAWVKSTGRIQRPIMPGPMRLRRSSVSRKN